MPAPARAFKPVLYGLALLQLPSGKYPLPNNGNPVFLKLSGCLLIKKAGE
jgi:hypothetical protein